MWLYQLFFGGLACSLSFLLFFLFFFFFASISLEYIFEQIHTCDYINYGIVLHRITVKWTKTFIHPIPYHIGHQQSRPVGFPRSPNQRRTRGQSLQGFEWQIRIHPRQYVGGHILLL